MRELRNVLKSEKYSKWNNNSKKKEQRKEKEVRNRFTRTEPKMEYTMSCFNDFM